MLAALYINLCNGRNICFLIKKDQNKKVSLGMINKNHNKLYIIE